jgi:hypothetical protein
MRIGHKIEVATEGSIDCSGHAFPTLAGETYVKRHDISENA